MKWDVVGRVNRHTSFSNFQDTALELQKQSAYFFQVSIHFHFLSCRRP